MELEAEQGPKEAKEEDITEETKRFMTQEMAKGDFLYLRRHLLLGFGWDPNTDLLPERLQQPLECRNQCYCVICDGKKELLLRHHWIIVLKRRLG